jgi:predicted esterase
LFLALAALALPPSALRAQGERFETGQRLRGFETAWDAQKDPAARRRTLALLEPLTRHFFAQRIDEVARLLDAARHALRSADEPPEAVRWAESFYAVPAGRLLEIGADELTVTLEPFYKVKAEAPKEAALRLTLLRAGGGDVLARHEVPITGVPLKAKLPLKGVAVPEGDHLLRVEVVAGGKALAGEAEQTVSFAADLNLRLGALRKAVAVSPAPLATTDSETVRQSAALLEGLAEGRTLETNFPAARLLAETEAAVKAAQVGKGYYGSRKAGQFWLKLATARGSVPVRLFAPEAAKEGKPLPLVIAMHGAGASENLFFEGYGNGAAVRLCRARGWLLVAPRGDVWAGPPVAEVIDEVARLYPVDRKRVFLVGHSMGAMQAVGAAGQSPERIAGVAALGGGGGAKKSEAIKKVPFFIAAGSRDFLLPMARSLRDALGKAGVENVVFQEYPDVEHLLVVQVALPAVFAFFDAAAKK